MLAMTRTPWNKKDLAQQHSIGASVEGVCESIGAEGLKIAGRATMQPQCNHAAITLECSIQATHGAMSGDEAGPQAGP